MLNIPEHAKMPVFHASNTQSEPRGRIAEIREKWNLDGDDVDHETGEAMNDVWLLLAEYDKARDESRRFKARADEFDTALNAMAELLEQQEGVYSWQRVYQNIERMKSRLDSIPSQISEAVKAERERNASVLNAGELLSTIIFNLSQQAGAPLSEFNANLLRKRCDEWDAAIRARGEAK